MAPPTVLSLFSGIGGIDLGLKKAGFRTICYVENDPYAVRVLQARMDGNLDEAPIWDDVKTFNGKEWRDEIDLVAGGFPCQDLSFAGKRAGINGSRSGLWAEMFRAVCEVRPRHVLVENVPGILVGGLSRVLGDMASIGYDAAWTVLSAAEVGAPHLRKRVFIVAYPDGRGCGPGRFGGILGEIQEGRLHAGISFEECGEGEEGLMLPTPSATPYGSNRGGAMGRVGKERPSLETMARKGLWRTPDANAGARGPKSEESYRDNPKGHAITLNDQVRWPTPRSTEIDASRTSKGVHGFNRIASDGREWGMNLGTAVKMWPSPKASDSMMGMTANCSDRPPEKSTHLQAQVAIAGDWKPGGGQLNPAWVEWLVGVPIGWTDLECAGPEYPEGLSFEDAWAYDPHPAVPRVAKGVPDRAKRLRCLGNIVVPQCAERIGKSIYTTRDKNKRGGAEDG